MDDFSYLCLARKLQGATYRGVYDPQDSKINFAVPSNQVLRKLNPFQKEELKKFRKVEEK